jgi:DNA-binding NtrC family response regulator
VAHDIVQRPEGIRLRNFHGVYSVAPEMEALFTTLRRVARANCVPVGGTRPITVDVRVISATNRALRREVAEGRFREDLSYRVRVVPLFLPPLRERRGDIDALFWHFVGEMNGGTLRRISGVAREAMDAIRTYSWPGNVRELRSAVEYAFVVGEGDILGLEELPPELRGEVSVGAAKPQLADLQRERLLAALAKHKGRRAAAAAELGISRSTLWRRLYAQRLR